MIVLDASALVELLLTTDAGVAVAGVIEDPAVGLHTPHLADVEVTQADWAPLVEVVHPAGKAGAVTPSKFWVKTVDTLDWPSPKEKVTVPRFAAPSCNWSVAESVPPQLPVAVKVKGRTTAAPLVLRTP